MDVILHGHVQLQHSLANEQISLNLPTYALCRRLRYNLAASLKQHQAALVRCCGPEEAWTVLRVLCGVGTRGVRSMGSRRYALALHCGGTGGSPASCSPSHVKEHIAGK